MASERAFSRTAPNAATNTRADRGGGRKAAAEPAAGPGRDPDIMAVERHLSELLGIGVAIQYAGGGKGALTLKFASLDQLDMICQRLSGESI